MGILAENATKLWESVSMEVFKWLLGLISLLITWGIGQKILLNWEGKKKKRELDITTINQFQQLYGEFKTVWRLWRTFKYHSDKNHSAVKSTGRHYLVRPDDNLGWELLDRATKAEGGLEAILIKIATERCLSKKNLKDLGLFRQAFQRLREDIRANKSQGFQRTSPEYHLFDELSCEILNILSFGEILNYADSKLANKQYRKIKDYSKKDWDQAVKEKEQVLNNAEKRPAKNIYQNPVGSVKYK